MTEILIKLGLNEDEAKTYLAALEAGTSTIANISIMSKLPRSSTYLIIEGLLKKGLITQSSIGKKIVFSAVSPETLLTLIEAKALDLENLEKELKNNLPQMQSLFNAMPQKPKVLFFEGFDGLKQIQEETLDYKEILINCSGYDKPMDKKMDKYIDEYTEKLVANSIKTYELIGNGIDAEPYVKKYSNKFHEIKLIDYQKGLEHVDKMIYGNKIAILSFARLNAVVIENKQIVDFEKEQFWKIWKLIN